ncbi:chemotaxis response regulator protein-glutamate methylesterase [Colwellia psychrerythraea]|uniref:Protein-glutamate methylesterase/protein-glutamine glutaminase n=1 Tax=Colwellia psychrerythraea TaxID=28229 RepID=A0A1Y5EBD8_COLPS|nr:chemotaxis response regulator protein-glutamate methylesterase [Colwellia psychrerythraea]
MDIIKVLIVDDSSVIRSIIKEALSHSNHIEVVGEAEDPLVARDLIKKLNPDVLTLDVEMPKMDGITFLLNLMRLRPMPVIMLSTLTTKGADITLQALEIGAVDFIPKPTVQELMATQDSFREVLIEKITQAVKIDQKNFKLSDTLANNKASDDISNILPFIGVKRANHLVAIGASTGGTEAIKKLLVTLPSNAPAIVITQHIPKTFSLRFAQRLNENCQVEVHEASHGQKIKTGHVYIAPGDKHLEVVHKNGALFCTLSDGKEVNRHKPAVDVLFDSVSNLADNVQAVLLTGMGQDGAQGMLRLKTLGARTLIQDKNSSLIWGMPGRAHAISAHTMESPLTEIAKHILDYASLSRVNMQDVLATNCVESTL